jgi:hypothetical protein
MVSRAPCKEHAQCTQREGLVFFRMRLKGPMDWARTTFGSPNVCLPPYNLAILCHQVENTCGIMWNYETHKWNYVELCGTWIRPYAHFLHSGYWHSLTIHTEEVPWPCVEWNETSTHSSPSWNHHDFGTRFYQGTTVLLLPWKLAHRRERVQCPPVYCSKNVDQ